MYIGARDSLRGSVVAGHVDVGSAALWIFLVAVVVVAIVGSLLAVPGPTSRPFAELAHFTRDLYKGFYRDFIRDIYNHYV